MTTELEVTPEDIADGRRANAWSCPIAKALARATGTQDVFAGWICLDAGEKGRFRTTGEIARFMELFDEGRSVVPFRTPLIPLDPSDIH